jgi:hypothetical protein
MEGKVMPEHFIVDWQDCEAMSPVVPAVPFVSLRMQGRKAGLYRVRAIRSEGMLLSHGAISFPVGTWLDVEDFLGIVPGEASQARVVANDPRGVELAW